MKEFNAICAHLCVFLLYLFHLGKSGNDIAVCWNNETKTNECCQDYKNISGSCEACLGRWGKNCSQQCIFGYYGHGCRKKCNCSQSERCDPEEGCMKTCSPGYFGPSCQQQCNCSQMQTCDNEKGCIDSKTTSATDGLTGTYLLALASLILLLLIMGIVRRILQELKQRKSAENPTDSVCATQEELVEYAAVRESQFIENASGSVFQKSSSLHCGFKTINGNQRADHPSMSHGLLHKQTLESNQYEKCFRESCDYDHTDFKGRMASPVCVNRQTNDYDKTMFLNQPSYETSCETNVAQNKVIDQGNDKDACNSCKEEHSLKRANKLVPVVRPYSSVKYNRREQMNKFS